jgi:hypothetical protein
MTMPSLAVQLLPRFALSTTNQKVMKTNRTLSKLSAAAVLACGLSASAQTLVTWTGTTGDFFDPTKWSGGAVPSGLDYAVINNGGTATIGATAGNRQFGLLHLGYVEGGTAAESGHVIMNGGTLTIGADDVPNNQVLIGEGTVLSTFIQNGGTIMLDAPETGAGNTSFKGVNEIDWEVGLHGVGRFEMHNDAKFFASDDLKIAENAAGNGSVLMDGNSYLAVGSGISISQGGTVEQSMVIAGNARVDSGNSMGAGNPLGGTDEGYLTMSTSEGVAKLTIQDNGILNIRRLTAREGDSTIIVKNRGQFHIFDVLNGTGTSAATRPPETGPNSAYGSAGTSTGEIILQDDAVMTVNSDPASGPTKGLGISAQRDGGNAGGKMTMTIRDRASLSIEQDLMLGSGADATTSDGTLEVIGPAANINIKGNLNMAVGLDGVIPTTDGTPAKSTLSAVITGVTHTTVNVGGIARIANGQLKVTVNGTTPAVGTTYTLIQGGTVEGQFASTDFTGAPLAQGLAWQVEYAANAVRLKVVEQPGLPGVPSENGLTPKTATIYINTPDTINNGSTEALGVAIGHNGNVLVGWEDDGDEQITDLEAVWTVYSPSGVALTPLTQVTSIAGVPGSSTRRFLSYFRSNGTATPAYNSWGPKIKANLFGEGFGMGSTSFELALEVPELVPIENNAAGENAGDYPTVQLLSSTGTPIGIVVGTPDAYAERPGDIRIGDWDYLSNGNILIAGESRQRDDLVNLYGGSSAQTHVVYRIVTPTGTEVKAVSLASSDPEGASEMWHGTAVARDGFALRFPFAGQAHIRLFNNDGTPASDNINLPTLTGNPITGTGGRGEDVGFSGNGKDAYLLVNDGVDALGSNVVVVTVINTNGTLRYSKVVSEDVAVSGIGKVHGAIDDTGRVFAVWDAQIPFDDGAGTITNVRIIMGRLLDPSGNPIGGTFYISEKELPVATTLDSSDPRVTLRGNQAAVVWETLNAGTTDRVVALRIFDVPTSTGTGIQLSITKTVTGIRLAWTGGTGPFTVRKKTNLTDPQWTTVTTTAERFYDAATDGAQGFFTISSGTP